MVTLRITSVVWSLREDNTSYSSPSLKLMGSRSFESSNVRSFLVLYYISVCVFHFWLQCLNTIKMDFSGLCTWVILSGCPLYGIRFLSLWELYHTSEPIGKILYCVSLYPTFLKNTGQGTVREAALVQPRNKAVGPGRADRATYLVETVSAALEEQQPKSMLSHAGCR